MCAEVNSRSALYQPLTEAELVRVVAAGLHTRPVSQKLLTGGLFNTTYLVNTAHCGKVVLRMGPVNRHLLMPFEHHLMESEAQVYDLLAQRGVAASEILAVDLSKTVVDRDFMFVRYLPSRAMSECDLAGEDRERVCRAIGEAAGRMHEICADRFGRVAAVSHGRGHARWSDALYADLLDLQMLWRIGTTDFPFSVSAYSTLGGISLYCLRTTRLSWMSSFNVAASTASVMFSISLRMPLYRKVPFSFSTQMTQDFHFPPNSSSPYSRGHRMSVSNFF